jgi:hypothetical protein
LEKPIILVNSCRYDQPYCWNGNMKEWVELNACLKRLEAKQLLISISNNKADQLYLQHGSGVASTHIPSLCLYTNVLYDTANASSTGACLGFKHMSQERGTGKVMCC